MALPWSVHILFPIKTCANSFPSLRNRPVSSLPSSSATLTASFSISSRMSFDSAASIDLSAVGGRSFLSDLFLPSLLIAFQQLCLLKKASILSQASRVYLWIHAWTRRSVQSASWPTSQRRSGSIRCWIRQWGGCGSRQTMQCNLGIRRCWGKICDCCGCCRVR